MSQVVSTVRKQKTRRRDTLGWLILGLASIATMFGISSQSSMEIGEAMTRNSARLALLWYWLAAMGMLFLGKQDWYAQSPFGKSVRWLWTWGAITFLVHVVVAFQCYHHWSHEKAYQHVLHASNFGEGIYVSYFFTILWTADAMLWWVQPSLIGNRSPWIGYAIHAFMLFIVFNGTVVFEQGTIRWLGVAMMLSLMTAWFFRRFTWRTADGKIQARRASKG